MARIALVSREVYPLKPGGLGQCVTAAATLLADELDVRILTTAMSKDDYHRLREAGDERLPPVPIDFVPEPTWPELQSHFAKMHAYSAHVYARLRELYPDGGPEVIEFPDYIGEGFVAAQAARTLDPFLAHSLICVRAHTTGELTSILDGFRNRDFAARATCELERYALAHADRLIWQGGDVLDAYRRFYGADRLAPPVRIRYPYVGASVEPDVDSDFHIGDDEPLRLLYVGRLERRKGIEDLVWAVSGRDRDDVRLTIVGSDTPTAPLGVSLRDHLLALVADDPRIELRDSIDRGELPAVIRDHHAVVVPSLWECWPNVALEALHLNRPLLATPVGGLVEMVEPGRSGLLTRGTGARAIDDAITRILAERETLAGWIRSGGPARRGRELASTEEIVGAYLSLAAEAARGVLRPTPRSRVGERPPLVSAIVPYHGMARFVRATIESLVGQTYPRVEIIVVNDGSFEVADWVLAELASEYPIRVVTQHNRGLGAARNLGVTVSRGRYVFPLDADNVAEPEFVERCVDVLEARPELAYVTSWSVYIDDSGEPRWGPDAGWQPIGNESKLNEERPAAGDAAAVLRRWLFERFRYSEELASYEDWHLYRRLARAGKPGAVIPERLIRYRLRPESMQAEVAEPNRGRLEGEIDAHLREEEMQWTSSSA